MLLYYGVLQRVYSIHRYFHLIHPKYLCILEINFRFLFLLQTKRDLEKLIDEINAGRPQCPVGLNTLVIPRKVNIGDQINQPYVYLNCGHVQGKHF